MSNNIIIKTGSLDIQFKCFHWLSHHGLAIKPCSNKYGKRTRDFFGRFYFHFSVVF